MSGGVLIRIQLPQAPTGSPIPFDAQTVGFTSRDADWTGDMMGTGESLLYRHGYISGDVVTSNRLDISAGKGGFAEAIEGSFSLVDACPSGTISGQFQSGAVLLRGADLWIGYISASGAISRHVQIKVADLEIRDDGTLLVQLKSRSYMVPGTIGRRITIDGYKKSDGDPRALLAATFAGSAGISFGGIVVSQKAGDLPPPIQLTWAGQNSYLNGNPSSVTLDNGITLTDTAHDYTPTSSMGMLNFRCKDQSEASRLYNIILAANSGNEYAVVFSDGEWFAGPNDYSMNPPNPSTNLFPSSGSVSGGNLIVVVGALIYSHAKPKFSDNNNPGVKIYLVPKNIAVCVGESLLRGVAIADGGTISIPGTEMMVDGIKFLSPSSITQDGYFAIRSKVFSPSWVPGTFANENTNKRGTGDTASIRTNPSDAQQPDPFAVYGDGTATFSNSAASFLFFGIELQTNISEINEQFDFLYLTTSAVYSISSDSHLTCRIRTYEMGVQGAFFDSGSVDIYPKFSHLKSADTSIAYPDWNRTFKSISEISQALHSWPSGLSIDNVSTEATLANLTAEMHVQDIFVWLFTKVSASDMYFSIQPPSSIYPIDVIGVGIATDGTRLLIAGAGGDIDFGTLGGWAHQTLISPAAFGNLQAATHGGGVWLAVGRLGGVWKSSDGNAWSKIGTIAATSCMFFGGFFFVGSDSGTYLFDPATGVQLLVTNLVSKVTAIACSDSLALIVGTDSSGATTQIATGASSWTSRTPPSVSSTPTAAAWGNGIFVIGYAGGQIATSPDGITWTQRTSPFLGMITGIAYGSGMWVACGDLIGAGSVHIAYSKDAITWTAIDVSALGVTPLSVIWANDRFIAAGTGYSLLISYGGTEWEIGYLATPQDTVRRIRDKIIGAHAGDWNPINWSGFSGPNDESSFGIAFDAPDAGSSDSSAADSAIAKICQERWGFAGETVPSVDGSTDPLAIALPNIFPGSIDDVATLLTVQYAPWAGNYLKKAYIQNVDQAYDNSKGDAFYFSGWDASGNTNGLAIWTACRNAYLASGILRSRDFSLDSVHDEATLGGLFMATDPDLGRRIDWICGRPRYVELTALGNGSASARAYAGCRYTLNQTLIQARGLTLPARGVVVDAQHDHVAGRHKITVGLLASGVNFPILFLATVGAILQVWCLVSGGTGWAGCKVMQSWDGNNFVQVGTIAANNPTGYLSEDMKRLLAQPGRMAHPGMVAGGSDILAADWSESAAEPPVPAWSDYTAGSPGALLWVDGEILAHAYQADQGKSVTRSNTLRRGLYGTQPKPHQEGSRVGAMTPDSFRWDVPSGHSGQTCYFRFPNLAGDNGVTGTYSVVIA